MHAFLLSNPSIHFLLANEVTINDDIKKSPKTVTCKFNKAFYLCCTTMPNLIDIPATTNYLEVLTLKRTLKTCADSCFLIEKNELGSNKAIEKLSNGENYFCEKIIDIISPFLTNHKIKLPNQYASLLKNITEQELQIFLLICDEYTREEMADKLFITKNTVETHRRDLLSKLNCRGSIGLVKHAIVNNLYNI